MSENSDKGTLCKDLFKQKIFQGVQWKKCDNYPWLSQKEGSNKQ